MLIIGVLPLGAVMIDGALDLEEVSIISSPANRRGLKIKEKDINREIGGLSVIGDIENPLS
jgi:hypothetical protein